MEADYDLLSKDNYMDLVYGYIFEFKDLDLVTRIQERGLYQNQKKKWI